MIIKTVDGKQFHVQFMKASLPDKIKRADGTTRKSTSVVTGCWVIRLGEGVAHQNPMEKYDHVFGKRLALQRALDTLPELCQFERDEILAEFEKKFGGTGK